MKLFLCDLCITTVCVCVEIMAILIHVNATIYIYIYIYQLAKKTLPSFDTCVYMLVVFVCSFMLVLYIYRFRSLRR